MDKMVNPRIVEILLSFDLDTEELKVKSGFMDRKLDFKDPEGYTVKMLEMAITQWVEKYIGFYCPNCDAGMDKDWVFCPACGYDMEKKNEG